MTSPEQSQRAARLSAQCQCGAVHYAVADEFVYAANCHCADCRRATGSAFKPFAGIARDKLRITSGADHLMIFGDDNGHDARCQACGSLLYSVVRDGAFVHVAMGTLVDDPAIRPSKHIFVGSKAPWFTITDDLPQYAAHAEAAASAAARHRDGLPYARASFRARAITLPAPTPRARPHARRARSSAAEACDA